MRGACSTACQLQGFTLWHAIRENTLTQGSDLGSGLWYCLLSHASFTMVCYLSHTLMMSLYHRMMDYIKGILRQWRPQLISPSPGLDYLHCTERQICEFWYSTFIEGWVKESVYSVVSSALRYSSVWHLWRPPRSQHDTQISRTFWPSTGQSPSQLVSLFTLDNPI